MVRCLAFGLLFMINFHSVFTGRDISTCGSFDIFNENDLKELQDCVKVEGHVQLRNFRMNKNNNITTKIEDISDYLFVHRVEGMQSLENIFPSLKIIRGHNLLFDRYSLIIYENREIRNIGLKSLLKIRNGHIKIESNPVLCYTTTINWMYLVENHMKQHFSLQNNKNPNECPKRAEPNENIEKTMLSDSKYFKFNSWNKNNYQLQISMEKKEDCPLECKNLGCTKNGKKCCSPMCLTDCLAENCRICKDFRKNEGNCVSSCNFPFYKLGDRCVTEEECLKENLTPHGGSCIEHCPPSYEEKIINGTKKCNLLCKGSFTIHSKKDLEIIRDCAIIKGSLHIELINDQNDNIIQDLENNLSGITEITDFLKVTKSPQIMSLGFLKSLETIRGENLINGEVAMFVVDNFHLEELFPGKQKIAIFKGRPFFHLNPMLCFEKILQLGSTFLGLDKIEIKDASHNSNGERNTCGNEVKQIFPKIEAVNSTAARVKLDVMHSDDRYALLGYLFYIKEAPVQNVTMFDGRHGCGRDNWKVDLKMSPNIRHVFSNLKPNTQYAYFVKTFSSKENNHQNQAWYSVIQYFKTNSSKPGPVQKLYLIQIADTAAIIHWWPPKNKNGVIEKYLIRHVMKEKDSRHSQGVGFNEDKNETMDCECDIKQKVRVPLPSDVNYYRKEKIIFETAAQNFVYISTKTIERKEKENREEDKTRRKRETSLSTKISMHEDASSNTTIFKDELSEKLAKHFAEAEKKSILEQDTGTANFTIIQPKSVCPQNQTDEYKRYHECESLERYMGTEVPGGIHSYILDDLQTDKIYLVFVRACVKGLVNGCGPEKSIEVETHSKSAYVMQMELRHKALFY